MIIIYSTQTERLFLRVSMYKNLTVGLDIEKKQSKRESYRCFCIGGSCVTNKIKIAASRVKSLCLISPRVNISN